MVWNWLLSGSSPAPARRTVKWLVSLGGLHGPKLVMMDVLRLGERLPSRPGVFLYAAHNQRHWTCLFVGETKDLRSRSGSHECLPEALLLGATHVHYVIMSDKGERLATAERLIFMHGPVLNAIEGPGLNELVQQGVPVMAGQDLSEQPTITLAHG